MGRTLLRVLLGLAAGAAATTACQIPDTLGLPCEVDAHCDGDQVCRDGVCATAAATESASTSAGPVTMSNGTVVVSSGAADSTAGSTGPVVGTTGATTGGACGIGDCIDLDVLVVLDNSSSMSQWVLPLANSLESLVGLISAELDQVCTYHVGIATGDPTPNLNPPICQLPGRLIQVPSTCSERLAGEPWLDQRSGTLAEAVEVARCMLIEAGTGGQDYETMLDALMKALDPANNEPGTCNDGFRRPDAHLLVVYLSDEDDPTPTDQLDDLAAQFDEWVDASRTAFISVVADDNRECPWDPAGTDTDGSGAVIPTKLNGFLALTMIPLDQRATVDICEMASYDFETAFDVITNTCGG